MEPADEQSRLEGVHIAREDRGESGFGTLLGLGTAIAAGVAATALMAVLHVPLLLTLAGGAAIALAGSGMMVMQHHKEKRNVQHARETFRLQKGYHKVREIAKDDSLIHLIKEPDDIPERIKYIKDNYGITPLTANQYRTKHMGTGMLGGLAATAAIAGGILLIAGTGGAALPFAATMGLLAGGTTFGVHSAAVMKRYDKYIDDLAAQGAAHPRPKPAPKAPPPAPRRTVVAQDPAPLLVDATPQPLVIEQPPATVEYANDGARRRSFAQEVLASRQQGGKVVYR